MKQSCITGSDKMVLTYAANETQVQRLFWIAKLHSRELAELTALSLGIRLNTICVTLAKTACHFNVSVLSEQDIILSDTVCRFLAEMPVQKRVNSCKYEMLSSSSLALFVTKMSWEAARLVSQSVEELRHLCAVEWGRGKAPRKVCAWVQEIRSPRAQPCTRLSIPWFDHP